MKSIFICLFSFIAIGLNAQQEELPYHQIPDYPEDYTAGSVAARMIDGLGFRYYHATDGLTEKDLAHRPSDMARTAGETIDHIYGLSKVIVNAALQKTNDRTVKEQELSFTEKRKQTLINFKTAADILRGKTDLADYKLIFKSDRGTSEFPFWNNINGPIADALWHCGQVVSFRRSSGNPFNSKVSVFQGKVRN
ncbi:hypothetical protein [Winogradskyella sp. 3972H.M.0a.05]|uniref:hypothetical protein n=1 Tax=Winogradskyella sp. 3972H.M.0a.05 TaxID=2950277 RepID=UPI0033941CDE